MLIIANKYFLFSDAENGWTVWEHWSENIHLYLSQTVTSTLVIFSGVQSDLYVLSDLVLPAVRSLFAVKQFVFSTIIIFIVEKILLCFFCSFDRRRQVAVMSSCVVFVFCFSLSRWWSRFSVGFFLPPSSSRVFPPLLPNFSVPHLSRPSVLSVLIAIT